MISSLPLSSKEEQAAVVTVALKEEEYKVKLSATTITTTKMGRFVSINPEKPHT